MAQNKEKPGPIELNGHKDLDLKEFAHTTVQEEGSDEYHEYLGLRAKFTGKEYTKLTRKVDLHVLPQLIGIYLLAYIDRTNVGNAKLFGAQQDLGMTAQDWNTGLTAFFITYALGGPPSNMLLKRYGPKKVLPALLFTVSCVLIGSGCTSNRVQWFALRMLLGLFEAGIYPGCIYTLTTWYTPAQIHSRTTIFYVGASLAGAFSGLLAYAIGQLDQTWGYRGWRFVYVIEGIVSLSFACVMFFMIQETPAMQGKWLNSEERRYLVLQQQFMYGGNRSGSKDEFRIKDVLAAVKSWHTWFMMFGFFSCSVALYGLSFSLPTIVANMGFSSVTAQALSAPPYVVVGCGAVLLSGWFSDKYRLRMWSMVIPAVVGFIGLVVTITTVRYERLVPLTYIGVTLGVCGIYCLSPCVSVWVGLNTAGQTKRAAAISFITVWAQFGGLVGSNIYIARESPRYPTGFGCSLAFLGVGCILTPMLYWWLIGRINRKREAMTEEVIYSKYTPDQLQGMGDLSPFYRYER